MYEMHTILRQINGQTFFSLSFGKCFFFFPSIQHTECVLPTHWATNFGPLQIIYQKYTSALSIWKFNHTNIDCFLDTIVIVERKKKIKDSPKLLFEQFLETASKKYYIWKKNTLLQLNFFIDWIVESWIILRFYIYYASKLKGETLKRKDEFFCQY